MALAFGICWETGFKLAKICGHGRVPADVLILSTIFSTRLRPDGSLPTPKALKKDHAITAVFEACEEGGFHAYIKEIPGVHSEGETIEEAQENLMDALHTLLAYRMEKALKDKDVSKSTRFEAELAA